MTRYDESFVGLKVLFDKENISNTIGESSNFRKVPIKIAETEISPRHILSMEGRKTILMKEFVNSPKVATYDLQPE